MNSTPLVSVIVPVHNVAPYLRNCADSLLRQTLTDIEIIFINDASTDNSYDILKEYAQKDLRVILINNEINIKTAETRNKGIELARGEYVGFVDGDDYVDENFFEELYKIAKEKDADIAKSIVREWKGNRQLRESSNKKIETNGKFFFFSQVWSAIYRRDLLEKHNIRYHVDFFCLQIQAVYYANKVVCTDKTAYNYVRHDDSCDSPCFTLEKWKRLNLGHANFIYTWIQNHEYTEYEKSLYLDRVRFLYFYGYNRLEKKDVAKACHILADNIKKYYHCFLPTSNIKKLRRILYLMNQKISNNDFVKAMLLRKI